MAIKYFNVKNGLLTGNILLHASNSSVEASTFTGNIVATNSANLGAVGNIIITGGTANYVLSTDGTGNLSWVAQTGGGGTYGNSNVADYLPTYTGNVSANYFIGNGATLTNVTGANVTGYVPLATTANTAATVTTNAQPNITSTGPLTSLTVSGNVDLSGANVSLGNVSNLHITGGTANYVLATDGSGSLSWVAQTGGAGLSTVTVDNFTGNSVQTVFTLSVSPTSVNNTFVNIDGVFQLRDAYSLSGANITFDSAPVTGASIEVTTTEFLATGQGSFVTRNYTGNGVQNTFTVTSGVTASSVLVAENGVLQVPTTDYTVSGADLIFTSAPANAVAIQIRELAVAVASGGGGTTRAQAMTMGIIFGG